MPRSIRRNKYGNLPLKPYPSSHHKMLIASLLNEEKTLTISRTILSGKKHRINLKHGTSNPGTGDCAFESIIFNINDRSCYKVKFPLSFEYNRNTGFTDMSNRTVDGPWNIYSPQQ